MPQLRRLFFELMLSIALLSHTVAGLNEELFNAVGYGNTVFLEKLLSKGANINAKSEIFGGITPLHRAVIDENFKMVGYLISKNANLNFKDNKQLTGR